MIDKSRLEQKCSTWNIALTGTQLDRLDAFAEILDRKGDSASGAMSEIRAGAADSLWKM